VSIFDSIFSIFCCDLFVVFENDRLEVTNLKSNKTSCYSPVHKKTGINIFSHPRILIAHFQESLEIFQEIIENEHGRKWGATPKVFVQNLIELSGGITEVEIRVIINSFERAGARQVYLVNHPTKLSGTEISQLNKRNYQPTKGVARQA
jgi:hypothetical protein